MIGWGPARAHWIGHSTATAHPLTSKCGPTSRPDLCVVPCGRVTQSGIFEIIHED